MLQKNLGEHSSCCFNSFAPGRSECNFKNVIFNLVLLIGIFRSSHHNALWWIPQDLTDDKSTLVQVMAWCCQATSHYLSQCWLIAPCRLMVLLSHNELMFFRVFISSQHLLNNHSMHCYQGMKTFQYGCMVNVQMGSPPKAYILNIHNHCLCNIYTYIYRV